MHIVIQGAGRGIGHAMAKQAMIAGVTKLILTARHPPGTAGFRDLPPSDHVHWVKMDFLDPSSINMAAADIIDKIPRIDRLVIAAGVLQDDVTQPEKRLADLAAADQRRQTDIAAAEQRQKIASQVGAANRLMEGSKANLQIQTPGDTPRTSGTQQFRRRKQQFNIPTGSYQGLGKIKSGMVNV